jgi:hypothetical protein
MNKFSILLSLLVTPCLLTETNDNNTLSTTTSTMEQYTKIQPQYPSYVDHNHFGLCLRAARDLKKGTIVATADLEKTDKAYIADNPDQIHIALMEVAPDGTPTWGKVRGKWAFCNHSCDPNCDMSDTWQIITNRDVEKGTELTTSYDAFIPNFPWPDTWNFTCLCQAPNCKKFIKEYRTDLQYPNVPSIEE